MISILLAVYNGETYVKDTLISIKNQTFKDFEVLIGLNGCTDNTIGVIRATIGDDERFKVFDYGNDKGKAKTLNKLLKESSREWISVQDADDLWAPVKLQRQMTLCAEADVIGSRCMYIDAMGAVTGSPNISLTHEEITGRCMTGDNQIVNSSAMVRRERLLEAVGWDESIDGIEDFDLWLKLIKMG